MNITFDLDLCVFSDIFYLSPPSRCYTQTHPPTNGHVKILTQPGAEWQCLDRILYTMRDFKHAKFKPNFQDVSIATKDSSTFNAHKFQIKDKSMCELLPNNSRGPVSLIYNTVVNNQRGENVQFTIYLNCNDFIWNLKYPTLLSLT